MLKGSPAVVPLLLATFLSWVGPKVIHTVSCHTQLSSLKIPRSVAIFLRSNLFEVPVVTHGKSKNFCLHFWSSKIGPTNSSSILPPTKELSPLIQKGGSSHLATLAPLPFWSSLTHLLGTVQPKSRPPAPCWCLNADRICVLYHSGLEPVMPYLK